MKVQPPSCGHRDTCHTYTKLGNDTDTPPHSQRFRRLARYARRQAPAIRGLTPAVSLLLLLFVAFCQVLILRRESYSSVAQVYQQSTPFMTRPAPRMFIGIKSSPLAKYRRRRDIWRKSACPQRYRSANIEYRFFVGRPLFTGDDRTIHSHGTIDHSEMRETELALQAEIDDFGDIAVLAIRDAYLDISHKLLGLLRYGFQNSNAPYIVEHDDEYCMDVEAALDIIDDHEREKGALHNSELYGGTYIFQGDEYESMKGAGGESAPFTSGWCTIFSRGLLTYILETDWTHTALFATYGTNSDDANCGKWVKYAQEKHGLRVDFRSRDMVEEVEKMQMNDSDSETPEVR